MINQPSDWLKNIQFVKQNSQCILLECASREIAFKIWKFFNTYFIQFNRIYNDPPSIPYCNSTNTELFINGGSRVGEATIGMSRIDSSMFEVFVSIYDPDAQFNILKFVSAYRTCFTYISISMVNRPWHLIGSLFPDRVLQDPLETIMGCYEDTEEYRERVERRILDEQSRTTNNDGDRKQS